MHDAVAATEVVCYASRKLVANAMHCAQQTTDPTGMRLDRSLLVVCCCQCWKQSRETRVTRVEYSEQSVSLVSDLGWLREAFPLLAPSTSKVSIDIFVRFPLASSAGRSVHTTGLPTGRHASQNSGLPTRKGSIIFVPAHLQGFPTPSLRHHQFERI